VRHGHLLSETRTAVRVCSVGQPALMSRPKGELQWKKKPLNWNGISSPRLLILGVVPDYSKGSMLQVSNMLKQRMAKNLVTKRKEGTSQSAPAWYKTTYRDDRSRAA
jgi:hypothetical protein